MFVSDYSRTMRAGELYEEEIFSKVDDNEGDKKRWLNNLKIIPKGETNEFAPKDNNWRRSAKVPILILNATCLNTGHNWQFTASWMGEPPAGIDSEVDANYRLRRMYYEEAPEPHKNVRLGYAVAASAAFPVFSNRLRSQIYTRDFVREKTEGATSGEAGRWWSLRQSGRCRAVGARLLDIAGE